MSVDLAEEVMRNLQQEMIGAVDLDFNPETAMIDEEKYANHRRIYQKIKPEWREEDRAAVDQIKAAAEAVADDLFGAALSILDSLKSRARQPVLTTTGKIQHDDHGRFVWERDDFGQILEDWDRVAARDIEQALMQLNEVLIATSPEVKERFLETVYAKYVMQDLWHEAYESVLQGTNPQREAVANRKTKDERYNYLFRFWIYTHVNSIESEIRETVRLLERIGYRRSKEGTKWN
jgi:hypothetical protein